MLGTILKIGASTCIGAFATGAALLIIGQQKRIRTLQAIMDKQSELIEDYEKGLEPGSSSRCENPFKSENPFKFGVGTTLKDPPENPFSSDMVDAEDIGPYREEDEDAELDKIGKIDTKAVIASISEAATDVFDGAHHTVKKILESDTASSLKSDVSKAFSKLAESDIVKQFTSDKTVTDIKAMAKEAHDKLHSTLTSATEVMKQYKPSEKTKTDGEAETSGKAAKGSDTGSDTRSDAGSDTSK